MHPAEQTELLLEVSSLEGHDETDETERVQAETNHAMVGSEYRQLCIREYDMLQEGVSKCILGHAVEAQGTNLEIVNDALAIEEIVGRSEEVPVQSFAPRVASCRGPVATLTREGEE